MATDYLTVAREILSQLLTATPMKGARLKPLLTSQFEARVGQTFFAAFPQFPKLLMFLNANRDLVDVELPSGPGDIFVRIRGSEQTQTPSSPTSTVATPSTSASQGHLSHLFPQGYLDAGLWHAFTNPDPIRKRFYNPVNREVVHFVAGSTNSSDRAFEAKVKAEPNLIEVTPIPAATQSAWMKSFLETIEIPDSKRHLLLSLAALPYTSQMNKAFTAALEVYANAWRHYRTSQVFQFIRNWAQEKGLPARQVLVGVEDQTASTSIEIEAHTPVSKIGDIKSVLRLVIDSLDDASLSQILIPASVLREILSKSRK